MASYPRRELTTLITRCQAAGSTKERGNALEDLCRFLLEKVQDVRFHSRDQLNAARSQEIDLSFWVGRGSPLHFMPWVLLVEAKNHAKPVSSRDVRWFVEKLDDRKLGHGILVAMNGISGSPGKRTGAWDMIVKAMHKGIRVVVLTQDDLRVLRCTADLIRLIENRFLEITILA